MIGTVVYIGASAIVGILGYLLFSIWKSGFFKEIEVSIIENPPILSSNVIIFYKYCMNSYKSASDIYSEVCDILPRGAARLIGIYYDCSSKIPHFQQAAIGCICEIDDIKIFETNFALQLTRRGFEKMTLPKISKAVYSSQKASGILSGVRLNNAREKVKSVVQGHGVHSPCLIEVHCIKKDVEYIDIFAPLDHLDELTVGEYIKESELEAHLVKQKFDSDEGNSNSHSETETESSSQIVEENDVDMSA